MYYIYKHIYIYIVNRGQFFRFQIIYFMNDDNFTVQQQNVTQIISNSRQINTLSNKYNH